MLNRLNDKERAHLAAVKELPCSVCDQPGPSEAHHIEQRQHGSGLVRELPPWPVDGLARSTPDVGNQKDGGAGCAERDCSAFAGALIGSIVEKGLANRRGPLAS